MKILMNRTKMFFASEACRLAVERSLIAASITAIIVAIIAATLGGMGIAPGRAVDYVKTRWIVAPVIPLLTPVATPAIHHAEAMSGMACAGVAAADATPGMVEARC